MWQVRVMLAPALRRPPSDSPASLPTPALAPGLTRMDREHVDASALQPPLQFRSPHQQRELGVSIGLEVGAWPARGLHATGKGPGDGDGHGAGASM
jgi:hypothetical protein